MLQYQRGDLSAMILNSKAKGERDTCRVGYSRSRFGREMAERLWE